MKILVISQYFYPETFRVNALCKELVDRGHQVSVMTGYPQYPKGEIYEGYGFDIKYEKNWNGVQVHRVKMQPRGKSSIGLLKNCISFVIEGNKWVRQCKEKFDMIYVFEVSPITVGLPAITYKKKFGTPILFNVQDLWPENVEVILGVKNKVVLGCINEIAKKIYKNSDKILCASQGFVDNIKKKNVSESKLVFWPQFCDDPNLAELKKPPIFNEDKFNIVFAGNVGEAQGLDLLLEALSELQGEEIECYIVGDGRALESLKTLAEKLKIENMLKFIGRVTEVEANEYVKYGDIAYMSLLDNEVFRMTIPAKLQTYLACGVPILGVITGESATIIEKNGSGIVSEKNHLEIAKAISHFRDKDMLERKKMGQAARLCYEMNYTKKRLIDELETLMNELVIR